MAMTTGKRLAILAPLLATGGCEFLKNHVKISSDEHSPFAEESGQPRADDGGLRFEFHLPLSGGEKRHSE
jgi:hypothetical protein